VAPVAHDVLTAPTSTGENSATVRARVVAAADRAVARQAMANSALAPGDIEQHCVLSDGARTIIEQAIARLGLSARAYHRILRVSRTIADLAGDEQISQAHIAEAIGFRQLDRG